MIEDMLTKKSVHDYRLFHFYNNTFSVTLSLIFYVSLVFIAFKTTNSNIIHLKQTIYIVSCFEILLVLLFYMTQVEIEVLNGHEYFIICGFFKNVQYPYNMIVCGAYVFGIISQVACSPIIFVVRYLWIVKNYTLSNGFFIKFYSLAMLSSSIIAIIFFHSCVEEEMYDEQIKDMKKHSQTRRFLNRFLRNGEATLLPRNFDVFVVIFEIATASIFFTAMATVTFCVSGTFKHLSDLQNVMTKSTRKMQVRLTKTLSTQFIILLLFLYFPIGVYLLYFHSGNSTNGLGLFNNILISWSMFLTPLSTIVCIEPYRKYFVKYFIVRLRVKCLYHANCHKSTTITDL
uniref:G_PROTEIN_RECEP_F1_2 domain-containing protein n=1 Tax=Rhabditophanes sp. KR3021 TaxID=114890 RepID=A0AC35TPB3_9BILA